MVAALPARAQTQRHHLGQRDAPRHFLHWLCNATTRVQNPERHRLGKTQSPAKSQLPLLHSQHRHHLWAAKSEKSKHTFNDQEMRKVTGKQMKTVWRDVRVSSLPKW